MFIKQSLTLLGCFLLLLPCATNAQEDTIAGPVRLALPPMLYGVPGIEMNVYFDNVLLTTNINNYAVDVICAKGQQQVERWTWTPAQGDVGELPLELAVYDQQNNLVARAKTTIHVAPPDAGAGRNVSVLMIGDSLTHQSEYPLRVLELCQPAGNPVVKMIGSFAPRGEDSPIRHEGYGGWTAHRHMTHFTETARTGDYKLRGSPFLYAGEDGKPALDFKRYCDEYNDGHAPDVVTIFLGPNDIYNATEQTQEAAIDKMLRYYDGIVEMVHNHSPQTRIGVMLPVPPCATQDGFGANSYCGQTRWQYRRNQHRLVERMIEQYSDREEERISLVPVEINIDCARGYPVRTAPSSAASSDTIVRQNNAVHPATSGYNQIGDALYCWLKSGVEEE
jgi:lysophospholipase L1-like esterase